MAGQPAYFDTPESFETACKEYFANNSELSYTITGLALYLGFESRQSFYDYEKREGFSYIVKWARMRVENSYEMSLRTNSVTGAIFALKNMGWKDKTETEHSGELGIKQITGMQVS